MFLPTLTHIFTVAQWVGIPTYGNKMSLVWAIIVLSMLTAIEAAAIWTLIKILTGVAKHVDDGRGLTARLSGSIFYGNGFLSLILSWKFISSWRRLSVYWKRAELLDATLGPPDATIQRRVIIVACFISICSIVEHLLSMFMAIGFDTLPMDYLHKYILNSHAFLIRPDTYSLWTAIPIFFISKIATILWNFQDLIIILISMGLTSRYHRLNLYVNSLVKKENVDKEKRISTAKYVRNQKWRRVREAYVRQATLVRMVDAQIGALVLLSNINNFFFICLQLFLGLNKTGGSLMSYFYYFLSLGWLLFRACSVVLAAADVHIYSRTALEYIRLCPDSGYNVEIKRLNNQLSHDFVALSGMGFFWLSRQTLLEVAGNIIKYELVLIQYDK
ncbi:gustatory receptor for sugar taste 64a-like [Ostrinia furnacalis]|uniref:gustatory receptor for sugar taste 64a-like n=1 Tax=Ostrinia furnacalis TaxID=93504 RepID=UPI00103EE35C|nr:gustatory receptor for sugar taste 64a-like [Ostrinia furnacalis]